MEVGRMVRMDETNKIRKGYYQEGKSIYALSRQYKRSWNTIERLVKTPREDLSLRGKRPNRKRRVITQEVKDRVSAIFYEEKALGVKKKQLKTVRIIYYELKNQGIYEGSERTLYDYIRKVRLKNKEQSYLPLSFDAGTCLQIDHGEFDAVIANERITCYLFCGTPPGLMTRYYQAYPIKASVSWGCFHEQAFRFFGGIFPHVMYDNDSVLVKKVLGTERKQTTFSLELEEHYSFHSVFCNLRAGHEKGSVEKSIGFGRKNYLSGLPHFSSWSALNEYLEKKSKEAIDAGFHYRTKEPLINLFKKAQNVLFPLPPEHKWVQWHQSKVTSYQVVTYENNWYSVAERYVGSVLRVAVSVFTIAIYNNHELIAIHQRKYNPGEDSLVLDHYLDQLRRKPGSVQHCAAFKNHTFEPELLNVWDRLQTRHPSREANKEFIKILFLRRKYSYENFITALGLALDYGSVEYDSIVNIINQLTTDSSSHYDKNWLSDHVPHVVERSINPVYDLSLYADLHKEV